MNILISFFGLLTVLGLYPKAAQGSLGTQIKQSIARIFEPNTQSQTAHSEQDLDTLARTIWGEARNEDYAGMQAVANVVMNRLELAQKSNAYGRQFGRTVEEICRKKYQFSAWLVSDPNYARMLKTTTRDSRFRMALDIARKALKGDLPDITGGADHYLNIALTRQIRGGSLPPWADMNKKTTDIGRHTFLRLA